MAIFRDGMVYPMKSRDYAATSRLLKSAFEPKLTTSEMTSRNESLQWCSRLI